MRGNDQPGNCRQGDIASSRAPGRPTGLCRLPLRRDSIGLCGLIDEVRLIPKDDELALYLVGHLAGILELWAKNDPGALAVGVQVTLVAGARNHPYRTNLTLAGKAA